MPDHVAQHFLQQGQQVEHTLVQYVHTTHRHAVQVDLDIEEAGSLSNAKNFNHYKLGFTKYHPKTSLRIAL